MFAMKYETIVKDYYAGLEEGKLLGRKCEECGAVEFPPVRMCNACSSANTKWVEVSGKAKLLDFTQPVSNIMVVSEALKEYAPLSYGNVQIDEGPTFLATLSGISLEDKEEIRERLRNSETIPLEAKIIQQDGYKTIIYALA